MKQQIRIKLTAFLLALAMALSLCACAVSPQEWLEIFEAVQEESRPSGSSEPLSQENEPGRESGPDVTASASHQPNDGTAEGRQSLAQLRDGIAFPNTMFGVAYLGYVGGLFEDGFETGFPAWLRETNGAMLGKFPFIAEIDADHIAGGAGHLYCIVPVDENATLAINRVQWNEKTQGNEITQVLYRSETGEPVLLFANLDDILSQADTQVIITDNIGNTCEWYPVLDEQGCIVPCITEEGIYCSADFTEYGWRDTPSVLTPWLVEGFGGMTAAGLAGWESGDMSCWLTRTPVGESGRSAEFLLVFYPGDEAGGAVDLYWGYESACIPDGTWSGFWSIETVMEGPSDVTLTLFHTGGESGAADGATYLEETCPFLMGPSGLELVIGPGKNGICLPFMTADTQVCVLTRNEA